MAKRLATEVVKACLHLSEAELSSLMRSMTEQKIRLLVKVLENGNQEVVLTDESTGEEVTVTFERKSEMYVLEEGFRTTSTRVADVLRKIIVRCKGDAIVHRIYQGFTMAYHYAQGSVVRIEEITNEQRRTVYACKNTLGSLEHAFRRTDVEDEIRNIRHEINMLLDQRNETGDPGILAHIDRYLSVLTHRLFILEA